MILRCHEVLHFSGQHFMMVTWSRFRQTLHTLSMQACIHTQMQKHWSTSIVNFTIHIDCFSCGACM